MGNPNFGALELQQNMFDTKRMSGTNFMFSTMHNKKPTIFPEHTLGCEYTSSHCKCNV